MRIENMSGTAKNNREDIRILPPNSIGKNFIPAQYIPKGKNEYYLRNTQAPRPGRKWYGLAVHEIEALVKNGNICDNWDLVKVTDRFDASLIRNTEFHGLVRIGVLEKAVLRHHDLQVMPGITDSTIIACDIGDNTAIHHVRYLAHYIIGDRCILHGIDEMHTTSRAKFGNGVIKEDEPESERVWIDLMNETGARAVMPFDGMTPGDAYLWARFRDNGRFIRQLGAITQNSFDMRRGFYGTVGDSCVIKSCRVIKDVKIGSYACITGANKLENLTIRSCREAATQIGEGVELVDGIIGQGCRVVYGSKAVRFIMGPNSKLAYGARLIHSYLGDNSTVACCELLNNLIFPGHEQHHNNSFLIAAVLMGQSNLAAGVTMGSNHNSRANDGEVQAGRGFWPGLAVTVKHTSRFASFTLMATGNYTEELSIPLPFSLVSNDETNNCLRIMPAFWWLYNMYALARNTWKFQARDKRAVKSQHIEFDALAPDTVEEIFTGREKLELHAGESYPGGLGKNPLPAQAMKLGRELLADADHRLDGVEILGRDMEKSNRKIIIAKAKEGYRAYGDMIQYYAVKNLLEVPRSGKGSFAVMARKLSGPRQTRWMNIGGQPVPEPDVLKLIADVNRGVLKTWGDIHNRFDEWWEAYSLAKQRHCFGSLCALSGTDTLSRRRWLDILDDTVRIAEFVRDQVYISRKKDYLNPFRQSTFRNSREMKAVAGDMEKNSFVKQVREETEQLKKKIRAATNRG
jgi:hypothetical protein